MGGSFLRDGRPGGFFLFVALLERNHHFLAVPGSFWLFLVVSGISYRFPTIFLQNSFLVGPSSSPALAQLLPSSPPALSQLFPSSCPRCCARVARVVKTLSQTLPDSPRFSQILPDSPRLSQILRFSPMLPDSPRFSQILPHSPTLSQTLLTLPSSPRLSRTLPNVARLCQTQTRFPFMLLQVFPVLVYS